MQLEILTCLSGIDCTHDESMRAYDDHYVFFLIFKMAYISEDFAFCEKVMLVIDRLYNPLTAGIPVINWWHFVPYNLVDAKYLDELDVNLKRIQLLERLQVVCLFVFRGVSSMTYIVHNDVQVLQNLWVYEQVLKVLPADRIMVI